MLKSMRCQFAISTYLKLGFVVLCCMMILCSCGSPGVSQKPPGNVIPYPSPVDPIVLPTPSDGHFYRLMGGGSLQNFPYERYVTDIDQPYYQQPKYQQPIVISSKDQVDEFFSETYSQSFSEGTGSWVRDDRFTDLINSYDEEFFESNELVTFILGAAGGGYHFELSKTAFENEVLTIEVDHIFSGPGTGAITDWFGIVEIEKKPTDYQIEIQLNGRNW